VASDKRNQEYEALLAVGLIDGRYRSRTRELSDYFSEYALIRYRVRIEIEWLISLAENPAIREIEKLSRRETETLRAIASDFTVEDALRVKQFETETNHDVKAVEYFLKEKAAAAKLKIPLEMIHFACTSEDISNVAWALMLKEFNERELMTTLERIVHRLGGMARQYGETVMIARTHGQEASPTTIGKEFAIFAFRVNRQIEQLRRQEYLGKANGAVGNYNAHRFAYPKVDWIAHSKEFVEGLGLAWNPLTTQIESHDFIAEIFHTLIRIGTILIDFSRDVWGYVALGYFTQKIKTGEVGSSVMPHKVNPIDFENCEGNLGVANSIFEHLAAKLPISRWQRDLSDSTAMRAIGNAYGHVVVALSSLENGLNKLEINETRVKTTFDDEKSWEVVAEAIQTLMRRYNLDQPYERLKELTRGRTVTRKDIEQFAASLPLNDEARAALARLEPRNYLGFARELVDRFTPKQR
jgi:adenylosuccinate lyase